MYKFKTTYITILKKFGLPVVVAINHFVTDTEKEIESSYKKNAINIGVEATPMLSLG